MTDWEATEQRLEERSAERRGRLARQERRRGWMPWVLGPLVFPALGAAAFLLLLEDAGGDFGGRPAGRVVAVCAACFAIPAALTAFAARRRGALEAAVWAVVCAGAQVAMVVGAGFVLLGLGPDA